MCYDTLRKAAEALETGFLEKQAIGDISAYSIDLIPDDRRIEACVMIRKPVSNIKVTFKLGSDATNSSGK